MHQNKSLNYKKLLLSRSTQYIFTFIVCAITLFYLSYSIIHEANWILGDDHAFWTRTAIGIPFELGYGIFSYVMRFMPIVYLDFNILFLFSDIPSPYEHYVWVCLTFLAFSFFYIYLLFCIEKDTTFSYSLYLLPIFFFSLFTVKDFMKIQMDLIFPERMIILFISLFLLLYYKALKNDKLLFYFLSVLSGAIACYYKEPVFGALLVIALFNCIFHFKAMTKNHKIFNILLIANAIIYLLLFYIFAYSTATGFYATGRFAGDFIDAFEKVFIKEKSLLAAAIIGIIRAYFIIFKKNQQKHSFFDANLYAGIAYAFAFIILNLPKQYYLIPAILMVFPALFYWSLLSFRIHKFLPLLCSILILLIPIHHLEDQFETIQETHQLRQEHMPITNHLASLYTAGYKFIYVKQAITNPNEVASENATRDYHKKIFEYALDFTLNKEQGKTNYFIEKESVTESDIDDKTILFYPEQNNVDEGMHQDTKQVIQSKYQVAQMISHTIELYYPLSTPLHNSKSALE